MSVVNRMLQDIDRRLGAATVDAHIPHPEIRSVSAPAQKPRGVSVWLWAAMGAVIAVGGMGAFYALLDRPAPSSGAAATLPRMAAPATPAAPVIAVPSAAVGVPAPLAIESAASSGALRLVAIPPIRVAQASPRPDRAKPLPATSMLESFKLSMSLSAAPAAPVAAPPAVPMPAKSAQKVEIPVRQVAAEEMVEAARMLWNEGSHGGALATLREALAAAEGARNGAATATLARELARLEIAANNAQAALELLRRHEPVFAGDADALALRGNAEQRLGLHGDAAQSYLAAIRLRPMEGRWMLGAAISLAASGRRDEAQAWAEKARERGALTPTLAAYLEQLGVPVRSDARQAVLPR